MGFIVSCPSKARSPSKSAWTDNHNKTDTKITFVLFIKVNLMHTKMDTDKLFHLDQPKTFSVFSVKDKSENGINKESRATLACLYRTSGRC